MRDKFELLDAFPATDEQNLAHILHDTTLTSGSFHRVESQGWKVGFLHT
jgi:hypothetical protein